MKKIAVLTSLLALTACGGGSHHAGDRVRVSEQPTYEQPYLLTSEETRLSNAQITNMVSEVVVCKNCSSPRATEARYSEGHDYQGKKFDVYDLSDVKFTMADEGALEPGEESFYFVIDETDNAGKIIGVNLADKSKEHSWRESDKDHPEHNKTKDVDADLVRTDENAFRGYVKHGNDGGWTEADIVPVFVSKERNLNLKYSDFGYFDMSDVKEGWAPVFIGGYDVKKIDPTKINMKEKDTDKVEDYKTFSGRAVGYVAAFTNGTDDAQIKKLDAPATLKFSAESSNLTADFKNDKWYKVNYNETYDDKGVSSRNITFSGNLAEDDPYVFSKTSFSDKDTYQEYEDRDKDPETFNTVESDIRYFGNSNYPIEAVGIIQVRDCAGGGCKDFDQPDVRNDEVRMNLSFGVNKD